MARTANATMMSMGTVNMWGFSPSFDMLRHDNGASNQEDEAPPTKNLLLLGPSDLRHVLQTIAGRRRRNCDTSGASDANENYAPLHIHIFESHMEVLARHLLLLQIALDWEIPLRQRCNLYLEVFGNFLVQERTSAYIEKKARLLIDFVHNGTGMLADLVDLSHLAMRSRDDLVDVFRSWFTNVRFDGQKLRDQRLRHYYEERYDYRNNLIDWDYTMNLKKIGNASVIHIRQYRQWRNTGIAFEFGDQNYTEPNRTMASFTAAHKKHHGSVLCRGYWGDIIVSPYIALGVDCDQPNAYARQLFEVHNKGTGVEQNRHNTTEVSVYNVLSFLYEIETGEVYKMKKAHDIYSGIGDNATDANTSRVVEIPDAKDSALEQRAREAELRKKAQTIMASLDGIKIIPLSGELTSHLKRKRYEYLFDHVFASSNHALVLQATENEAAPALERVLADRATVSIESSMFMIPLKPEQRSLYADKLSAMADAMQLQPVDVGNDKTSSSGDAGAVVTFAFHRPSRASSLQ